jgi:pyruvate-formate lyase-activating enzyme
VKFVNSFDTPEDLKTILDFLKDDYAEGELRPLKVEFSPYISKKLEEIAKTEGITQKEALEKLVKENFETMEKADAKQKEHSTCTMVLNPFLLE